MGECERCSMLASYNALETRENACNSGWVCGIQTHFVGEHHLKNEMVDLSFQ